MSIQQFWKPAILETTSSVFEQKILLIYSNELSELLEYIGEKKIFGHVASFWISRNIVWMLFVEKPICKVPLVL